MDNLTPDQRHRVMSRIRSTNTKPERVLRRALRTLGIRARARNTTIPGRPDFVFPKIRVAVFVDGDFWHGWRFEEWRTRMAPYWLAKIERNMRRDKKNELRLNELGWVVLRLWEHELEKDPEECAQRVVSTLSEARSRWTASKTKGSPTPIQS